MTAPVDPQKYCPCCKQWLPVRYFRRSQGSLRSLCAVCNEDGDAVRSYLSEVGERIKQEQHERRFRALGEARAQGTKKLSPGAERQFWNLASDPFPELWKGMGLHASYTPVL